MTQLFFFTSASRKNKPNKEQTWAATVNSTANVLKTEQNVLAPLVTVDQSVIVPRVEQFVLARRLVQKRPVQKLRLVAQRLEQVLQVPKRLGRLVRKRKAVQVPSELLVQRKSHVVLHLVALVLLDATAPNHASVLKKVDEARASLLPVNVQLHPPRPNVAVELPVASVQMDANVTAKPWIPVAKSRDRQVQLRLGPPKPVARVLKSVDVEMDVIVPAVARVAVVLKRNKRQSKTLSRIGSSIRV